MLVILVSKVVLALTHDMHDTFSLHRYIPRWSSGQDFALSPRRPGFDSPSGKTFLLVVCSDNAIDFRTKAIRGVATTVCCEPKPFLKILKKRSLRAGFEPAREDPIGFQVQRLNHSAITAYIGVSEISRKVKVRQAGQMDRSKPNMR